MEVGVLYESVSVCCEHCMTPFAAVIETDFIKWDENTTEVKLLDEIQCPYCSLFTIVNRQIDNSDDDDFLDDFEN